MRRNFSKSQVIGWIGITISTLITCLWAFWGITENYHEGWYYESWILNVGLLLAQYLSPMIIFMGVTIVSIYRPRLGAGLHGILAILGIYFFQAFSNAAVFLIILPMIGLGALYWFGRSESRRTAVWIVVGFPTLILIVAGIKPALRASQRFDDENLGMRMVQGNGVNLTWAPSGPGWPDTGVNWSAAQQVCQNLEDDGLALASVPLNIWRLPTVNEAVRSMTWHGQNSGGVWNMENSDPTYSMTPDKESPLWNVHSQVIYWWTATEVDEEHAYIIVYDGKVYSRSKQFSPAYLGFRCVKEP